MNFTENLKDKVLNGYLPNENDALALSEKSAGELAQAADEIRARFCGSQFHLCTIINAKSGNCPENCKFCAQSCHYNGSAEQYGILPAGKICDSAVSNFKSGVQRFSLVTSGRALTDEEIDKECDACRLIRQNCGIGLCASCGLLKPEQLKKLRTAGVTRYHCNMETSRDFFPNICTTHNYDDKIKTIEAARNAGMEICSGGIIGLGETMRDRIQLALTLRELRVVSVPINILNPIPGTPLENNPPLAYDEIRKTVSIFRFLLPTAEIRLAGGRILLPDKGVLAVKAGLSALISGDMLTTSGINTKDDIAMAKELGYTV